MPLRALPTGVVVLTCFAAAPTGPARSDDAGGSAAPEISLPAGALPSREEFGGLLRSDPVRAFEMVLRRYKEESVRGYTCVMRKRERAGGTLGDPEEVDVAFRDDPFSVFMAWRGPVKLGKPVRTLYVRGENQGMIRVKTRFLVLNFHPDGPESRAAARYSIEDFGFYNTTLRTLRAWKAARDEGRLRAEYLGRRPVAECGDRVCHVIRRTCDPPEVDTFSLADRGVVDPATRPDDAFTSVTLMFDAETWFQVGSEQRDAADRVVGEYYFRDVKLNPSFRPDQFTPAALR